jgi:hypothetical protein
MKSIAFFIAAYLLILVGCQQRKSPQTQTGSASYNFIHPPLPGVDVPTTEYDVDAAHGDTLFYKTGSMILFPAHSFVDKSGKLVEGKVQVTYREFIDPIDFYLSGIPMNYDSIGKQYVFESSGMCEILAFQNGMPVYVNQANKPEIIMTNISNTAGSGLYYLDTVQQKWINKGSPFTAIIKTKLESAIVKPGKQITDNREQLIKPVKPEKARQGAIVLRIVVDPASFKELLVYDNLKFQIDPGNNNFDPRDSEEEWSDVELKKGENSGLYKVQFSNSKRIVSYAAKPVLEGEDYDKAMQVFEAKVSEYNGLLKERLDGEAEAKKARLLRNNEDSIENHRAIAANKRIEELNRLIEAENRRIVAKNKEIEKRNKEIQQKKAAFEQQILELKKANKEENEKRIQELEKNRQEAQQRLEQLYTEQAKQFQDKFKLASTIQQFPINSFGIWNCDRAFIPELITIRATFRHTNGDTLPMTNMAVVTKSVNSIRQYGSTIIGITENTDNMLFGVYGARFVYMTYENFRSLGITAQTKEQLFSLTVVSPEQNNYEFIKKLIMQ